MNNKLTIVGIETITGSVQGLDIFERNIYDRISVDISGEQFQTLSCAGSILEKAVSGALKNTSSKIKEQILADSALILIADEDFPDQEYDCKFFEKENNPVKALEKASIILNKDKIDSVIIAVSDIQNCAAAIVLKTFEKARVDQNRIYAVIDLFDTQTSGKSVVFSDIVLKKSYI
jgi:hypothetical protein